MNSKKATFLGMLRTRGLMLDTIPGTAQAVTPAPHGRERAILYRWLIWYGLERPDLRGPVDQLLDALTSEIDTGELRELFQFTSELVTRLERNSGEDG